MSVNDEMGASPGRESVSIEWLLRYALVHWKYIASCAFVGLLIALRMALAAPNSYTATATALPPQESGKSSVAAKYAGIAEMAGISLPLAQDASVDLVLAILKSRALSDAVITRFGLEEYYRKRLGPNAVRDDIADAFLDNFTPSYSKRENLVTIKFTSTDRTLSANVVNGSMEELQKIYNSIKRASAGYEADDLKGSINRAMESLSVATSALLEFQKQSGAVQLETQTKSTIEVLAKLQQAKIEAEIEAKTLAAIDLADDNPRAKAIALKVQTLTSEIDKILKGGAEGDPAMTAGIVPLDEVPTLVARYARLWSEVRRCEALLATLSAQLESAKVASSRTQSALTIVDRAVPPERKSGPARRKILFLGLLLGASCGMLSAECFRRLINRLGSRIRGRR